MNIPFNITIPHYGYGIADPLVICKELDYERITRKIYAAVLDIYKNIPTEVNKYFGKNVRLDIFLLDNKFRYFDCINAVQQLLNWVKLSDQRVLEVAEVLWGDSNYEWSIPNCRLTIRDHLGMVECYLTIRFIPLPSFVDMIALRAKSLYRSLNGIQQSLIHTESRVLIDYLKQDLDYVRDYRNESLGIHREIDLLKYYCFMGDRGFKGYGQNLSLRVLHGAFQLLETYNHHLTLNKLTPLPPVKLEMSNAQKLDELQEHIYNSLASFGKSRTNYSFQFENKKWEFKREVEITEKLVTYLENSKEYTVQGESPESSGKVDIKIGFKHSNMEPVMIEVKLLRAAHDKKMPTPSDILKPFKSAVSQLAEYTRHTHSKGMLLFFTLDLNEGQVAQVIEDNLSKDDYEFIKLHKKG